MNETMKFSAINMRDESISSILRMVYDALAEKGYTPVNQMVGYILSGDPSYITSHKDARNTIQKVDRNEILEELLKSYLQK